MTTYMHCAGHADPESGLSPHPGSGVAIADTARVKGAGSSAAHLDIPPSAKGSRLKRIRSCVVANRIVYAGTNAATKRAVDAPWTGHAGRGGRNACRDHAFAG